MLIWSLLIWDWYLWIYILDVVSLSSGKNRSYFISKSGQVEVLTPEDSITSSKKKKKKTPEEALDEASRNLMLVFCLCPIYARKDQGSMFIVTELVQKFNFRVHIVLCLCRYITIYIYISC